MYAGYSTANRHKSYFENDPMKTLIQLIYSFLILPLLILSGHLISIFNPKVRKALYERYRIFDRVSEWAEQTNSEKTVLIHAASMGEFEHIKPVIKEVSVAFKAEVVVTFFSPSAYENVKRYKGVDLFLYAPFDFAIFWRKLYRIIKPRVIVISKHDAWPNQVWTAQKLDIPVFLVNASLHEHSSRLNPLVRPALTYVYRAIDHIFTISDQDRYRFERYFNTKNVRTIGDTKFDQVLIRKEQSYKQKLIEENWLNGKICLLFGSVWPEDSRHIVPALETILINHSQLRVILVPHQPHPEYIHKLKTSLQNFGVLLLSEKGHPGSQRVLLVDRIGVLADLYRYAQIAYVGGSFHQGIHNVLEAAIYEIPVLYGPVYKNSLEAIRLNEAGGSKVVHNKEELSRILSLLITDNKLRKEIGAKAGHFARSHTGATGKLKEEFRPFLE